MNTANSEALSRQLAGGSATVFACFGFLSLLFVVLMVAIYWKLFSKAGYSGWLSLLMFVPIVNFGMILFLAFSDWPVLQQLRAFQSGGAQRVYQPAAPQPYGPPAPPMRGDAGSGYAPPVPTAQPAAPAYQPAAPAPMPMPVAPAPMPVAPAPVPVAPAQVAPAWEPPAQPPAAPAEPAPVYEPVAPAAPPAWEPPTPPAPAAAPAEESAPPAPPIPPAAQ